MAAAFDYKQESKNQYKENSKRCYIIKYGRILRTESKRAADMRCYYSWLLQHLVKYEINLESREDVQPADL